MRPLTACMLSERRAVRPFGLKGGGSAAPGLNLIVRKSGHTVNLGAKNVALFEVQFLPASTHASSFLLADPEKFSAYACGFDPFDDARRRFDIQFYLVSFFYYIYYGGHVHFTATVTRAY